MPGPATCRPAPAGRQVEVWWADATGAALRAADLAVLSRAEQAKAESFVFPADRQRYQAAHVTLRRVLASYTGTGPATLEFTARPCPRCGKPRGKPVLAGGGPAFSLAHCGDVIVVAVAGTDVGVDVECEPAGCLCPVMSAMHPADAAEVADLPEPERHTAILRWWVHAEAALKCAGTGIAHGMDQAAVLAGGDEAGCSIASLPAPAGCLAAVALAGTGGVSARTGP